jgi:hypothetical protein
MITLFDVLRSCLRNREPAREIFKKHEKENNLHKIFFRFVSGKNIFQTVSKKLRKPSVSVLLQESEDDERLIRRSFILQHFLLVLLPRFPLTVQPSSNRMPEAAVQRAFLRSCRAPKTR